jgi:hypothetical protein
MDAKSTTMEKKASNSTLAGIGQMIRGTGKCLLVGVASVGTLSVVPIVAVNLEYHYQKDPSISKLTALRRSFVPGFKFLAEGIGAEGAITDLREGTKKLLRGYNPSSTGKVGSL